MMQSPLLGYSAFSHFLQQQQQQQASHALLDGRMTAPGHAGDPHLPGAPSGVPRFLATSLLQRLPLPGSLPGLTRCPSTSPGSSESPSPSCSPPAQGSSGHTAVSTGKSFTIDAILGLSPNAADRHPRFIGPLGHPLPRLPFHLPDSGASSPTDLTTGPRSGQQSHSPTRRPSIGSECGGSSKKSSGGGGGKSKRVRTIFTAEQLERLEAEFERQQYMVGPERLYLAHALNLTEAQVKVWFQNRRIKWRKQHLEMQQQRLAVIKQQQLQTPQQQHHDQPLQQQQQHPEHQNQQLSPQHPAQLMDDSDAESLSGDESSFPSLMISVSSSES